MLYDLYFEKKGCNKFNINWYEYFKKNLMIKG